MPQLGFHNIRNRPDGFAVGAVMGSDDSLGLLVDAEAVLACGEEGYHLTGGGDAGVDVGLGCLRTHLFRCEEYAVTKTLLYLHSALGGYVGGILEVGTCVEGADESFLVNHLLAGGVDEKSALGHGCDKVVADGAAGLGGGGDVDGHNLVLLIELLDGVNGGHAGLFHDCVGAEGVESRDAHAESAGYAGHVATHLAEGLDAEGLVLEFGA